MTDERIWEQASIGERVEMLRGRVDRIEAGPPLTRLRVDDPVMFCGVTREDIARLRRIEEAASELIKLAGRERGIYLSGPETRALREALRS